MTDEETADPAPTLDEAIVIAKRWTTVAALDPEDARRLAEWAVNLAVARGSWMAVETDLVDEAGLSKQDAEDLALQLRILIHWQRRISEGGES